VKDEVTVQIRKIVDLLAINLDDQVIFYYLKERMAGQGYILLFYNRSSIETRYDRAIFFFDDDDVLTRYAYSNEALPYTE
jgi:hypothetical protein